MMTLNLLSPPLQATPQPQEQEEATPCSTLVSPDQVHFDFSLQSWPLTPPQLQPSSTVGEVHFLRFPIFNLDDPAENNWLFRGANRFHIDTRERTLRHLLLFSPGDPYNPRQLEESARLLRQKNYLYDAKVFPFRVCGQQVDVMVVTRDVWTLVPGFSLSRTGGVNSRSLVLRDSNFLGLGKRISLERKDDVDREGWQFGYEDDNLFNRRLLLNILYADNRDGESKQLELSRPFFSLDTRWSAGMKVDENERTDKLYLRGDSIAEFRTREDTYEISGGFSDGWYSNITRRWLWGFSWQHEQFEPLPDEVAPEPFPPDREINTLWVGRQKIEDRFTIMHNFNHLYRTEDINFGKHWSVRFGWSDSAWGSDRDRLRYAYNFQNIRPLADRRLLSYDFNLAGYWDQDNNQSDDLQFGAQWRYYHRTSPRFASYASLQLDYVRNLPPNRQLLLGGEENLRGYPLRYQAGDRRFLLTLERRFYSDRHWWRLFRVGAAAFVDIGRAWFPGEDTNGATGVLSNVGLGLRISSSRAEKTQVLHIDFAIPLQREEDVDSIQFIISGKEAF